MTDAGKDDPEYADRIAAHASTHRDAWSRTLDDMQAMAEELEAEGWETLTIAAGHTAPNPPEAGDSDRWGLVHVVPGNKAEPFTELVERGEFPQYQVFQQSASGRTFMVTQLLDPDLEAAVFIAGTFEMRHAPPLVKTAEREGEMYTHVQKLDGTRLGTFQHEDHERFFPDPDVYDQFVVEAQVGGVSEDETE